MMFNSRSGFPVSVCVTHMLRHDAKSKTYFPFGVGDRNFGFEARPLLLLRVDRWTILLLASAEPVALLPFANLLALVISSV
jgi:hypothetical protein